MRSIRRAVTPLFLLFTFLVAQSLAVAARPAPAPKKERTEAQLKGDQARSEKMKAKWADPAQAAEMVKARHGGNATAAKSYRMKAQWADPNAAAKLTAGRHGGNAKSAKSYRAKAQWADPGKRQNLLEGQARGRASKAAPVATPAATESALPAPTGLPAPRALPAPTGTPVSFSSPLRSSLVSPLRAVRLDPKRGRGFSIASRLGLGRFAKSADVKRVMADAQRTAGDGTNRAALTRAIEMLPTEGNMTAREKKSVDTLRGNLQMQQARL